MKETDRGKRINIWHLVGTILAVGLLIYLFSQQGWDEILEVFKKIPTSRLALMLLLTIISRIAVGFRWHVLLVAGGIRISIWDSQKITFAGLFASQFLPTTVGGDVIRLAGAIRIGIGRTVSLASLVVDRLVGLFGMAMAVVGLLAYYPLLSSQFSRITARTQEPHLGLQRLIQLQLTTMIIPLSIGHRSTWLHKIWIRIKSKLAAFKRALSLWMKQPRALLLSLTYSWVHMLSLFASIYICLDPLGEEMPFGLVAGLWSLTYFITLLPISLNGLGIQELSVTFFYTQFGGISLPSALAIALLVRVFQMFASLPGVVFLPSLMSGSKLTKNNSEI